MKKGRIGHETDITLPGKTGRKEAMRMLKEVDTNVKGIASRGYSNDPIIAGFRSFGFCDIIKPYRPEELKKVPEQLLGEG